MESNTCKVITDKGSVSAIKLSTLPLSLGLSVGTSSLGVLSLSGGTKA
ncbi:hypothetical protein [Psychrobacter sp. BF1]|nr:hypothetical protein [Psychrobacter sp. BF1]